MSTRLCVYTSYLFLLVFKCIRNNDAGNNTKDILQYWQYLRQNDCFTDLTVYCGMDFGCVSLHGAVLGACSPFISSLLTENSRISPRDENVLFLPDCEKDDFVALVKVFKTPRVSQTY